MANIPPRPVDDTGDKNLQQFWTPDDRLRSGRSDIAADTSILSGRAPQSAYDRRDIRNQSPEYSSIDHSRRSVAEAQKKAQAAILNLWPFEVRYQTYIDEGFDESIVRRLFDSLGMENGSSKPLQSASQPISLDTESGEELSPKRAPHGEQASKGHTPPANAGSKVASVPRVASPRNGLVVDKPEERKDRIARLLAEKTSKQLPRKEVENTQPSVSFSVSTAKPKGSSDKEKLLKQKMEALRKSREERAQKAAAKSLSNPPIGVDETNGPDPPKPASVATSSSSNKPSPGPSQNQASNSQSHTPSIQIATSLNQQPPVIPGLFLTSTVPPGQTNSGDHMPRKRPVASDFDTSSSVSTPKRLFGHSRDDQPLVIDVSDDELMSDDEDVAMDIDSQVDHESPERLARPLNDPRYNNLQKSSPLTDFPSRKPFIHPGSAVPTPPLPQTAAKNIIGNPQDLQRKEKEIEEMKRKIAEAEKRKKAKQNSSGTNTPTPMTGDSANINIASKIETSKRIEQLINGAEDTVNIHQQKLFEIRTTEAERAAELKADSDDDRRLRREKLANDLPLVTAEVEHNKSRLEQLRAEIARIEAAVQKSLEEKQRLAEEMQRLGHEAEEQLQAQKDKLTSIEESEKNTPGMSPDSLTEHYERYILQILSKTCFD